MPEWIRFISPREALIARQLSEVIPLIERVEQEAAAGRWCCGFIAYEAAPAFDAALETRAADGPLAWFGIFDAWSPAEAPSGEADALELAPSRDAAGYAARIDAIKNAIARGETYQVNFTFPLAGGDPAAPAARFAELIRAQQCRYGALIETPDFAVLSASPELFFLQDGDRIVCKPMKGTARRGRWEEEDQQIAARLAASPKERAENVMIVDMMRNDLGRIARPGSVRVERLFDVERLPTVWQMTSTVAAETGCGLTDVFRALFPCASVTGAPKVQTMRIIRALEMSPRGIYTGAVGFAGPRRRARFNVAIRTLWRTPDGRVAYGVGSGVVWDSRADREYAECLAKARVLGSTPRFDLFTTLRWQPGVGCALWARHAARLQRAADYFGRPFDAESARRALESAAAGFPPGPRRVRLRVSESGAYRVDDASAPADVPARIALAAEPLAVDSPFVFHKTTHRAFYDAARAARPDADDVLLWNADGEITETTFANVAFLRDGNWVTPPIACGLLGGVMREELLARGEWREGVIRRADARVGEPIQLANALRGRWSAVLVG